jgi:hypothetical protein
MPRDIFEWLAEMHTRLDATGGERTAASDVNLSDLDLILLAVDAHLQSKGLKVNFRGVCTGLQDKAVEGPMLFYESDDFKLRILTDGDILECAKWQDSNRDDPHEEHRFSIHDSQCFQKLEAFVLTPFKNR